MDCASSVAGPTRPNLLTACCSQFQSGLCDSSEIQSLPPMAEVECQRRCRAENSCIFYSSSPEACLLHSSCPPERKPCQGCRSGPRRPPVEKLPDTCDHQFTTSTQATTTAATSTPDPDILGWKEEDDDDGCGDDDNVCGLRLKI